jgi:transcriptional regulator with XRE-family HTH domain
VTSSVLRFATTAGVPVRMAENLLLGPEQLRRLQPEQRQLMRETGQYLRDLRQVAGLTLADLSEAMEVGDHSLLQAVEQGTATLSFELILRLAALLARHDPVPFVARLVRSYNPEAWSALERWGIGRLPLQLEREREFLNVLRRHDAARRLSDEGFAAVLGFTRAAFEMALHFAVAQEGLQDQPPDSRRRSPA